MIEQFSPSIPLQDWEDLHRRLAAVRWPDRETVGDRTQGVPLDDARLLIEHWLHRHDWRGFADRLNRFPHFRTSIDGVQIHFIHVRSPEANALPIILTHGWPGSFLEFTDVIGPLSDPARHGAGVDTAFHVVIPLLPRAVLPTPHCSHIRYEAFRIESNCNEHFDVPASSSVCPGPGEIKPILDATLMSRVAARSNV